LFDHFDLFIIDMATGHSPLKGPYFAVKAYTDALLKDLNLPVLVLVATQKD